MLKQHPFLEKGKNVYGTFIYQFVKRMLDIILSSLLIVLCVPIGCIICWQIRKREGEPVFVKQLHVGKNGKPFSRLQFRTHSKSSSVIYAFPPQPLSRKWKKGVPGSVEFSRGMTGYLHQTGRFIRKYYLQHLPELLHVLKGNMSIVGPRPELMEIAAHYNNRQRRRLLIKPGITGLAQLKGYTYEQHKKMIIEDLLYVRNRSIWLDMKIIVYTLIYYPSRYQRKREAVTLYNHSIGE